MPKAYLAYVFEVSGLALVWALYPKRLPSLLLASLVTALVSVFWLSELGRGYGILVDPRVTERMATASTIAATGNASETCFAREANPNALRDRVLAQLRPHPRTVAWLFSSIPALLVPTIALAVYAHRRTDASWLSALGVLFFWPAGAQLLSQQNFFPPFSYWGDAWGAIGFALFVSGLLAIERGVECHRTRNARAGLGVLGLVLATVADPGLGTALGAAFVAALLLTRDGRRRAARRYVPIAVALVSLGLFVGSGWLSLPHTTATEVPAWKLLGWSVLGQPLWIALACYSVASGRLDPGRLQWLLAGFLLLVACAFRVGHVPLVSSLAIYRLGVIFCAVPGLLSFVDRFAPGATLDRIPRRARALAVLIVGALSPLCGYRPDRLDSRYIESVPPLPTAYTEAAAWTFEFTPPDSVFVADRELAPLIGVFAGRRFLRADGLAEREDEAARQNVEARIVGGRNPQRVLEAARRFGVSHLAINRAAETGYAVHPEDFERRPPFRKVHQIGDWLYVFALEERVLSPSSLGVGPQRHERTDKK